MPSIKDLPFELLSEILSLAAEQNIRSSDSVTYTYGLTDDSSFVHQKQKSKHLRGRVPTDIQRWQAVDSFRSVNSRWHQWALSFALKELYIRRWRGGETWLRRDFEENLANPPVVYQDPYRTVKSTARLFSDYPRIAAHLRRIWFNGIYRHNTTGYVFKIVKNCVNVRKMSLPWTTLRYGTFEDWENVTSFPRLTSLEFLAVALRDEVYRDAKSHVDGGVLHSPRSSQLDFSRLRRIKFFGDSNILPFTDDDLIGISRTATRLEEILVSNVSSVTTNGLAALLSASRSTVKLLDYTPPTTDTDSSHEYNGQTHICTLIASSPQLCDLAITLPSICPSFFSNPSVAWGETVRIRVGAAGSVENFIATLDAARQLNEDREMEIEIAVGPWLFDTKKRIVHGNFKALRGEVDGLMMWGSVKGPYGYTGIHGDVGKGEWTCISEQDWWDVVRVGLVQF